MSAPFFLVKLFNYAIVGLALAVANIMIIRHKVDFKAIALAAGTGTALYAVVDTVLPQLMPGFQQGLGLSLGIGYLKPF